MITYLKVADVLDLPSIEYGLTEWDVPGVTARQVIEDGDFWLEDYHMKIQEQMRIDGINAIPIHVADAQIIADDYSDDSFNWSLRGLAMGNGHHRLAISVRLGHKYIKASDDIMDTGEADDLTITNDEWEEAYYNDHSEDETRLYS